MVSQYSTYRSFLKGVLAERIAKNPSYSLRALARDIGISPAHLSLIYKGTKNLSPESAHAVATRLSLKGSDAEYFALLVEFENAKNPERREAIRLKLRAIEPETAVRDLSLDVFKMIADWYHIPILLMTEIARLKMTPKVVAARLGISVYEAEVAIERLMRLELLEPLEGQVDRYRRTVENGIFYSAKPDQALKHFHTQMLNKAIMSLTAQTPDQRVNRSETFAIHPSQLPGAKKIIEEFCRRLVAHFDDAGTAKGGPTEVYHLETILFRVTQESKK